MDPRCDLYAVGLVMAECVLGKRVVTTAPPDEQEIMDLQLKKLRPVLSGPVFDVVERSVRVQKEERWASAGEAVAADEVRVHGVCMSLMPLPPPSLQE